MNSSMDPRVLINYYLRKGWYDHVQRLCEQILEKKGSDSDILFWRAFGIVLERSYSSAIRELENLKRTGRDVELPCLHALVYAHSQCKHVDHDEVAQLELQLVMAEENASSASLMLCATFFWHLNEHAKARKIIDQILSTNGKSSSDGALRQRALILRGWVDLTVDAKIKREADLRDGAIRYFDQVTDRKDAELVLGMAKYFDVKKAYPRALESYDELTVQFPWFKHSLSEKALVLLKMGSWDQCMDSVERVLSENAHDIEALRIMILLLLSREGRAREAAERIRELLEALKRVEPANPELFCEISRCTARVSDRDAEVLQCSLGLIEHAIQLNAESGAFRAERGYQRALLGDFAEAMESYKEALKLDESNEMALHGMIYCQIKLGQLEDASQQMEFLCVIQESLGASASFAFLQALLSWEKDRDRVRQVKLLQQTMQIHMDRLKETIQGPDVSTHDTMSLLNPLFLVEVATEFVQGDTSKQGSSNDSSSDAVTKGISILEKLVNKSPGFLRAQFVLAQAYFGCQRLDEAYQVSNLILKKEPGHSKAHLMHARVSLEREHFKAASASLDQALSYDFSVRQSLSYYIIKARILENAGDVREALQTLQTAMNMIQSAGSSGSSSRRQKHAAENNGNASLFDKASVYIHMAQVLSQLNDIVEATKTVREALDVFRGTSEEVRVLVANSELAIKRGDYDAAIAMLSSVPVGSPAFTKAQMVKADIYLQYRKDKHLYARCYQELVAINPCHATHVSLAEAYLRIQMLDEAVQSFERAKALSPGDPTIAGRIGRVLISKHDYLKAVDYYETALKMAPGNLVLRKDLAELYAKLRHFDQALRVVQQAPPNDSEALSHLLQVVELQLVLPSIHRGLGSDEMAVQALLKAYAIQKVILDRQKDEQPDVLNKQRAVIASTCFQIANIYASASGTNERENVVKYCTLALRSDETHESSLLYLARAYQQIGDLDQCQVRCSTLLRLNPAHEEAALMLADLLLQKEDNDSAIYHFQQLLDSRPDNFAALSRFLVMLRRAGKLHTSSTDKEQGSLAQRYLRLAERSANVRVAHAPGLHFCKGLYARYRNNVVEAIDEFNLARRDPEWGERALINMIEIYLNPDNENLWDSANDATDGNTKEQTENLRIANTLLDELPIARNERDAKLRVLEAYAVLAVRTKSMLDKAIQIFMEILETVDRDYVPALLGLATGYMLIKQQPKARNQLKRIAKMTYDQTLADEFERSYLLLADIYINRGKFDLAQELCKRSLTHNKSAGKAWELLGLVMEKEQSYIDAAECYQEAWTCEGEASAAIGFKLAFNYLKAKKLVLAVDVCNKVLDQYPDYPKIRKEILEKAYAGFRP
ncbi:Tetratricopeptide repeat [Phytophthora infestans]|uniref:Tetratricopeptide repeat n=1 Tax=Phytophthora infestans TaxID=4787 RepID=A0A8S9VGE4_PHYIN|nr:Tetratricopeptide repeat [Phytophthora infestans]